MSSEKEKIREAEEGSGIFSERKKKIWQSYLLPAAFCCIVYIADVATDIALVERYFADRQPGLASITLLLVYAPPLVFFIITILDKTKRPAENEETEVVVKWYFKEIARFLFFPVNAVYRFAGCLFWSTEALLCPEPQQAECIQEASRPSFAELYLLLQAFLQAAPQAVFQMYILTLDDIRHYKSGSVQLLSIITSISSVAIITTSYMRFESQRRVGRPVPWHVNSGTKSLEPKESLMTTIESQMTSDTNDNSPTENAEEGEGSPKPSLPKGVPQTAAIMSLPPLPPQIRARLWKATGDDELPEDLQKHLEHEEEEDSESLNIRAVVAGKSPSKEVSDSPIPEPPEFSDLPPPPPPPPLDLEEEGDDNDSLNNEKELSKTEETEPLSNEPLLDDTTATLDNKPPTPLPECTAIPVPTRKWKTSGLAEDEISGKVAAFFWWFFFVSARVLTFGVLAHFFLPAFFALVLLHYIGMVLFLHDNDNKKDYPSILLKLGLGFIYLFSFVELRTKLKKPVMFTFTFMAVGLVENVISGLVWYLGAELDGIWYEYLFALIIIGSLLGSGIMVIYIFYLKPDNVDVYE